MRFCFIVFCFIPAFCLAQLDSTCVKPFFDKTEFPNVVKIYYEQNKHLNGKLKSEGWIIEELGGRNSSILKVEGLTEETTMYHKIGVWKYYYPSGKIEGIDTIRYENHSRIGSHCSFYKNGELKYKTVMRTKNNPVQVNAITEDQVNKKMYAIMEEYDYNKQGKLTSKKIWEDEKLVFHEEY